MRKATFRIGPESAAAELSIVTLPGEAGSDLSNVNRWRGQIGLPPIDAAALKRDAETVSCELGEALLVDYAAGDSSARLLAAILRTSGDAWFFKVTGPGSAVEGAKPAFKKFLKSLSRRRP